MEPVGGQNSFLIPQMVAVPTILFLLCPYAIDLYRITAPIGRIKTIIDIFVK